MTAGITLFGCSINRFMEENLSGKERYYILVKEKKRGSSDRPCFKQYTALLIVKETLYNRVVYCSKCLSIIPLLYKFPFLPYVDLINLCLSLLISSPNWTMEQLNKIIRVRISLYNILNPTNCLVFNKWFSWNNKTWQKVCMWTEF